MKSVRAARDSERRRTRVLPLAALLLLLLASTDLPARAQAAAEADAAVFQRGLAAYEAGDAQRAFEIWSTAAADGEALSQYGLGKLYETGLEGFPPNMDLAIEWYEKAAEQGVPAALNNLGRLYADGRGVARDTERAVLLWAQAAQLGHPHAQYNLGVALFRGEWVERDQAGAVDWFLQSAAGGLPEAQFAAGQILERGMFREADPQAALEWYRRAAAQGHPAAAESAKRLAASLDATPPQTAAAPSAPQMDSGQTRSGQTAPAAAPETGLPPIPPRAPERESGLPAAETPPAGTVGEAPTSAEPSSTAQVPAPADTPTAKEAPKAAAGEWRVWLGSADTPAEAEALARSLVAGSSALAADQIDRVPSGGGLRLLAGNFGARTQAVELCNRLRTTVPAAFCIPVED